MLDLYVRRSGIHAKSPFLLLTRGTMKNSKFATSAAVTAAVIVGIAGPGIAASTYAASTPGSANPGSKLITAIAQRFNLKESDVQQVFNDQHTQMQAAREQQEADRLTQAVKDGKLTQAQADAITAKQAEMKAAMESLKGKTPAERQVAMKTQIESLKKWATDNKIPQKFFPLSGGPRMGHGHQGFEKNAFGEREGLPKGAPRAPTAIR